MLCGSTRCSINDEMVITIGYIENKLIFLTISFLVGHCIIIKDEVVMYKKKHYSKNNVKQKSK